VTETSMRAEFEKWWLAYKRIFRLPKAVSLEVWQASWQVAYAAGIEAAAKRIEGYTCPDCRHEGGLHYNTECGNADLVAAVRELAEKTGVPKT
jgi:hypothetical protein